MRQQQQGWGAKVIDQLAHDAVTLGTQKLGFERLGLYFCNPDEPLKMTGTYGTDANGNICVESGTIIQMNENDWIFQSAYLGSNHVRVTLDVDLYQPAAGNNINYTVNPFAKSGNGVESWFRVNGAERGHGVKHLSN